MMYRLPLDPLRAVGLGLSPLEQAAMKAITAPLYSAAEAALAESSRMMGLAGIDPMAGVTGAALAEASKLTGPIHDPLHDAVEEAMRQGREMERLLP